MKGGDKIQKDLTKISKYLSYILRHQPDAIGLSLDASGWASVDDVISLTKDMSLSQSTIELVVETNDKQRYKMKIIFLVTAVFLFTSNAIFAKDLPHTRLDKNGNGVRDDVDTLITSNTKDKVQQSMILHYAFFLSRFIENNGFKLAQDHNQIIRVLNCASNETKTILPLVKARILDSEAAYDNFLSAERTLSKMQWTTLLGQIPECEFISINELQADSTLLFQKYDEDLCDNIREFVDPNEPRAKQFIQDCRDAQILGY